MRRAGIIVLLAGGWLVAGTSGTAGEPAALERAEAVLLVPALAEENEHLRERVRALEAQTEEWMVQLAEARMALDALQVERERLPVLRGAAGADVARAPSWAVTHVHRALALVVLEGGADAGLRPGLTLAVVRGSDVVARVRVVEVRQKISGARIEWRRGNEFPQPGDRAMVGRSSSE